MSRRVCMTEYLAIDLDNERWVCRSCDHDIESARDNYKKGCLVRARDPGEIHKPLIDPDRYEFTYKPDSDWVRLVEFYCPGCGTMFEVEYLPPGHPPVHQLEFDIDALKEQVERVPEMLEEPTVGPDWSRPAGHSHRSESGDQA